MPAWTNPSPDRSPDPAADRSGDRTATHAGILRPEDLAERTRLTRHDCGPGLAAWVENYWTLTWRLPPGRPYPSRLVPHPACNLSAEFGDARPEVGSDPVVVTGVPTRRFDVDLSGSGRVVAVKFRPGGLAALTGVDAATLTDRVRPLVEVLPTPAGAALAASLQALEPVPDDDVSDRLDHALDPLATAASDDPHYRLLVRIVRDLLTDRELSRVGQVVERFGIPERRLQRLFLRYVGVPPKWVIGRYRLHDAITSLDRGYRGSLADLASSLGWYDQAHFNREFTAVTGVPPGEYRARLG